MSKQNIAPTRGEGIPTPGILAETPESGNTPSFSSAALGETLDAAITDKAIGPMQTAVDALGWIATIQEVIAETVEKGVSGPQKCKTAERLALCRIRDLAEAAKHLANSIGNRIDCERETLRDEHLPRLLAALPNGGEA